MEHPLPLWSLDPIYSSFEDPRFTDDVAELERIITELTNSVGNETFLSNVDPSVGHTLLRALEQLNTCLDLAENLKTYAYAAYSTDTTNSSIVEQLNRLERFDVSMRGLRTRFRNVITANRETVETVITTSPEVSSYRFVLQEEIGLGAHQMAAEMEELAADLARSGAELWSRLQESVSSTLSDGREGESKTVVELRALAHDGDRRVRKQAYERELALWRSMEIPIAHAINGVKGFAVVLDQRRGFTDSLERSVLESRMTPDTFDALIATCEAALPTLQRYLRAKAAALGQERLAFFDLFAPVVLPSSDSRAEAPSAGDSALRFSFAQARELICEELRRFSPDLGSFAEPAFAKSWVDARPRPGKVGGAYCVSFPIIGESRILCNFDGSLSSISTVAHELGHAYHHELLKNYPALLRHYPMTLAETASIFCETLVYRALVRELPANEKATALDASLQDTTQVIVDILSRFRFERELFRLRSDHEISPQTLCDLMVRFQSEVYGDILDPELRHPYMWAVKGHYYNHDLSYYNYPYAFGLLFSLSLLAEYDDDPGPFPARYRELLAATGAASVEDIIALSGLRADDPSFWSRGRAVISAEVERFVDLVEKSGVT